MPAQVFLIRHGQSTFNEVFEATGVDPLHFDARLTELGHRQVAAARAYAQDLNPDLVVLSPLTRAIETGLGLFHPERAPIVVSPLHRERLGNSCDVGRAPQALAQDFPMLDFGHLETCWWHDGEKDRRGVPVEPDDVFAARVAEFARWLSLRPEKCIAVVGHGTFLHRMTGRHFANCEIFEWVCQPVTGPACGVSRP